MTVQQQEIQTQPRGPRPGSAYFAAQQYASLGLSPFPVRNQSKVPAVKCREYIYNPTDFTREYARQEKDPDTGKCVTVRKVSLDKNVNIGLRTGYEQGLAVLNFDTPKQFTRAVRANPAILKFPVVKTARGFHVYYRPEAEEPSRNFDGGRSSARKE